MRETVFQKTMIKPIKTLHEICLHRSSLILRQTRPNLAFQKEVKMTKMWTKILI